MSITTRKNQDLLLVWRKWNSTKGNDKSTKNYIWYEKGEKKYHLS